MDKRSFSLGGMLIVSIIMVLASLPIAGASEYTPERLVVTVYSDGWTRVDFTVSVDPLLTSVDVSLLGDVYENMVVLNEEGVPLDFQLLDGSVQVDTVGSLFVLLSYDTLDLTSKEGRVWTIAVNAQVSFILRFPEETTILDLSSVPESITTVDGRYVFTMSAGPQSVSYIVGIVGSEDQAELLIEEAQQSVDDAEAAGADVSEAESALQEAEDAFSTWNGIYQTTTGTGNDLFQEDVTSVNTVSFAVIDGAGGVIAVASLTINPREKNITGFTITFDSAEPWADLGGDFCPPSGSSRDVRNVAAHEIGHPAGLDHVNDPTSGLLTMYRFTQVGETYKRSPEGGDLTGFNRLYG